MNQYGVWPGLTVLHDQAPPASPPGTKPANQDPGTILRDLRGCGPLRPHEAKQQESERQVAARSLIHDDLAHGIEAAANASPGENLLARQPILLCGHADLLLRNGKQLATQAEQRDSHERTPACAGFDLSRAERQRLLLFWMSWLRSLETT